MIANNPAGSVSSSKQPVRPREIPPVTKESGSSTRQMSDPYTKRTAESSNRPKPEGG